MKDFEEGKGWGIGIPRREQAFGFGPGEQDSRDAIWNGINKHKRQTGFGNSIHLASLTNPPIWAATLYFDA